MTGFVTLVQLHRDPRKEAKPARKASGKTCGNAGEDSVLISGIREVRDYIQQEATPVFQVGVIAMGSQGAEASGTPVKGRVVEVVH